MKIPYEVTFLVYVIQKFCSSSPHTAKLKKNIPFEFEKAQAPLNILFVLVKEYTNFTTNLTHQVHPENAPGNHWSPRPQIESTLWRSDCTSPGSPSWEKDGKSDVGILCKQKNLYIISSYIKLYINLCRYQSVSIYIYVNLYSNFQYVNLCNPCLRHFAVVHKVHGAFSTRGRCQGRENLREKRKQERKHFDDAFICVDCQVSAEARKKFRRPQIPNPRNSEIYIYIYARPPPPRSTFLMSDMNSYMKYTHFCHVWNEFLHELPYKFHTRTIHMNHIHSHIQNEPTVLSASHSHWQDIWKKWIYLSIILNDCRDM